MVSSACSLSQKSLFLFRSVSGGGEPLHYLTRVTVSGRRRCVVTMNCSQYVSINGAVWYSDVSSRKKMMQSTSSVFHMYFESYWLLSWPQPDKYNSGQHFINEGKCQMRLSIGVAGSSFSSYIFFEPHQHSDDAQIYCS